jgi:hypothetical protein
LFSPEPSPSAPARARAKPATASDPGAPPDEALTTADAPPNGTQPPTDVAATALAETLTASAPTSTADGGVDLLRAKWPEVVALLSQSPPIKPLIVECRPVTVDGPLVTLGFPEDKAFLKDLLERRRSMLEDGIGRVLGRAVSVRCVATNLEDVPAVPVGDAADLISEARRIFAEDLVDVGEVS